MKTSKSVNKLGEAEKNNFRPHAKLKSFLNDFKELHHLVNSKIKNLESRDLYNYLVIEEEHICESTLA